MTKLSKSKTKDNVEKSPCLYVGTTEDVAKEAPLKGLQPIVVLSDVYPGFFASQQSGKWGIIEIYLEALLPDNLAPIKKYNKYTWRESLKRCGVCLYKLNIFPMAIAKVAIYDPTGIGTNTFINESVEEVNPFKVTPAQHQSAYLLNLGLTRWLNCDAVSGTDLLNGDNTVNKASKLDKLLQNRNGLELFYRRTEKGFHSWWKA